LVPSPGLEASQARFAALLREQPVLLKASSVAFWRRPVVFPEFPFRGHLFRECLEAARARARAADRPARHSASPAALARPARAPRRVVSAAWGAQVPRLAVEGA
jgi:hypothetical protein